MFVDPVCYQQIEKPNTILSTEYEGVTFYFCSQPCKRKFDFEPGRYADESEILKLYKAV